MKNLRPVDTFRQNPPPGMCMIQRKHQDIVEPEEPSAQDGAPLFQKGRTTMEPISKEYLLLFNAITDAQESLDRIRAELLCAQQQAEELYLAQSGERETA